MIKLYLSYSKYLTVLLVCGALSGFAQQKTVSGKVTSSDDGAALPGVNILEKGTNNGSVSDANGEFKINVGEGATLTFSFIGYKSQEISIGSQTTLTVLLQTDVVGLSEIVVIGYGQQEKKDVTGSVVAVGTKDFNRGIMSSPQDMLLGKVAGVQITSADGSPGASSTIKIRGTNSLGGGTDPLIVIDGFPVDNSTNGSTTPGNVPGLANPLSLINPNDIETMTVLKDASATAIYGLRAANGVIIITTKKGAEGKPQVSLNSTVSVSTPQRYFDVLTGDQMRSMANSALAAGVPGLSQAAITNRLGTANTNWQKQIYQSAVSNNQNLSVAGTYKSMPYRVSYGYTDQEGLLKTTNFVRNSINLNLTPTLLDGDLQVAATFKGMNTQQNFGNTGAIGAATSYDPTQPVYNGNTKWGGYTTWVSSSDNLANGQMNPNGTPNPIATANPIALLNQTDNRSTVYRGIGNLKLDYRLRFFPALKLTMNAGFDYSTSTGHNNNPNNAAFTAANGYGSLNNYTGTNRSRLLDLYANYTKAIDQHKLDVTAGYSYQSFEINSTSFIRNGQANPIYQTSQNELDKNGNAVLDGSGKPIQVPYHAVPQLNYLLSFFARANYSFADKYLLSLSLRDDASSRFAKQNQFIIFPSAAVGWRINKESFMEAAKFVSDLKLRGSYGITGNQNINLSGSSQNSSYPYLGVYQQSTTPYQYQFGGVNVVPQRPQAYDTNIKWETTAQTDIGLDFGFLNNRITGTIDVYQKNTSNLLNQIPVALGSNFSNSLLTNVGSMTNKGIEFAVNALVVKSADFQWNFGFNIAHNENQVTKLLKNNDPNSIGNLVGGISGGLGGTIQNQQVGYPINSFFVFQQVYNPQGKPIEGLYVDQTGLGGTVTGNNANRIRFHSPNPTAIMGINSRFSYKKFDLYLSGHAVIGNYVYNNNQSSKAYSTNLYYQSGYFNNVPSAITDTNFIYPQSYSSYYVQNATFFRMDNMNLGYNLGEVARKLNARVSFTVQNAFFITKYKGVDPEVNGGIDNNLYPRPRVYMLGVNLTY